MKHDVKLVRDEEGDWEGLYVDEVLVRENHSLNVIDVLDDLVELKVLTSYDVVIVDEEDMERLGGNLPNDFEDIIKRK